MRIFDSVLEVLIWLILWLIHMFLFVASIMLTAQKDNAHKPFYWIMHSIIYVLLTGIIYLFKVFGFVW